MADDTQVQGKKVKHENIFAALAAFQGENPEIKKTKRFGKEGEKMSFMYAPLDEFVSVVRPLTSKHGLSFTWEEKDGGLACALYHETYKRAESSLIRRHSEFGPRGETYTTEPTATFEDFEAVEENVIRSMPIKVKRDGDMKQVGGDSTYARRYTLGEVLGIAAEEDTDVGILEGKVEKMANTIYQTAKNGIDRETTDAGLKKQIEFLDKQLVLVEQGKPSSLNLTKEQINELAKYAGDRRKALKEGGTGTGSNVADEAPAAPGENDDTKTGDTVA